MRERCSQRDLFEQATMLPDLRPDLRTKLALLLQTLLTEAASQLSRAEDPIGEEDGHDPDHD